MPSKAKYVRERCLDYIHLVLEMWELGDRDGEVIYEAVRLGLEDASVRSRENARFAYLAYKAAFPRRAEKLFLTLPVAICTRLNKMETDHVHIDGGGGDGGGGGGGGGDTHEIGGLNEGRRQARRMSHVDDAVASIQALMRGALTRRLSVNGPSSAGDENNDNDGGGGDRSAMFSPDRDALNSSTMSSASASASAQEFDLADVPAAVCVGARAVVGDVARIPLICGTIKFVGLTLFSSGCWVGLELDSAIGKNDGSVQGNQYFTCPVNKGIFVRPNQVNTNMFCDDGNSDGTAGASSSSSSSQTMRGGGGCGSGGSLASPLWAPSPSPRKEPPINNRHSAKSLGLIKLKLSQAMDILSQQLEIAEQLDATLGGTYGKSSSSVAGGAGGRNGAADKDENSKSANVKSLIQEARTLNELEKKLCEDFSAEIGKLAIVL
jgi:hypothetical protein